MKIVLGTSGSRGDVQPLFALALALKKAGHTILLCAPPEHSDWIQSYGCPFHAVGSNLMKFLEETRNILSLRNLRRVIRFLQKEIETQVHQLPEAIEGADLVLGSSLLLGAPTVAEYFHIPYHFVSFCPQMLPSRFHPMPHVRNHNMPKWMNRIGWWVFRNLDLNFNYRKTLNNERNRLGLAPVSDILTHLLGDDIIVASDPLLGTVPADVVQSCRQIGYLHLEQKGELDPGLEDFIHSGPPPVYIGFGSMPSEDPAETTQLLMDAIKLAGQRVILSRGWAKLESMDTGIECYVVGAVPHALLFPKMGVVVHHGGAGTTATAAKAGVPQIIIPHLMDQFYWAHRICANRLGPEPIRRSHLTAERLARAITACFADETFAGNAREYAGTLQRQSPQSEAVRIIETWIGGVERVRKDRL
jgi:UDP:flavonoid glycosyltransferase YjiC (YdhE family)